MFIGVGMVIALGSSILFDRFDSSSRKPGRTKASASFPTPEAVTVKQALPTVQLTPITAPLNGFAFLRLILLELKLLFKGLRWWWYLVAGGLIIASLFNTPENVRSFILPVTWLWPVLIWSGLGNREMRHNVGQMVFSSASPLIRQLPATWLAGFLITIVTGSGAGLKFLIAGDGASLLVWFSAAIFIPSLALVLGVWSKSQKLFEVLHVTTWYLALNGIDTVDYFGANGDGNIGVFIPLSLSLIVMAFIGRTRQLQN
jgi:hypothetical protein